MSDSSRTPAADAPVAEKRENLLLNLALNIVIPTIVLMKLSGDEHLGNKLGLIVALAFPIGYGIYDFKTRNKINFFSILGFVSVLLTGGISLLELDPKYIAIKEASIPGLLGIATLISIKTPYPLIKTLMLNESIIQVKKITAALAARQAEAKFQASIQFATILVACSFFLSSSLNYILAKIIVVSNPGTEQFNVELGKLTALSYPVIALPSLIVMSGILFYLVRSITRYTGLSLEEIMVDMDDVKKPDLEKVEKKNS